MSKIEALPVEEGKLSLSGELLPEAWTAPMWVLWEADEPYVTLFPALPDRSVLEDAAGYGEAPVVNGVVTLPAAFLETLSDPNETVTVRAEESFVEIFGARVWNALQGTSSPDVFW